MPSVFASSGLFPRLPVVSGQQPLDSHEKRAHIGYQKGHGSLKNVRTDVTMRGGNILEHLVGCDSCVQYLFST